MFPRVNNTAKGVGDTKIVATNAKDNTINNTVHIV